MQQMEWKKLEACKKQYLTTEFCKHPCFILNKVLKMTICAKWSYILEPKKYQKILTRFV